jgi:thiaminase/transcriptional activator TenA
MKWSDSAWNETLPVYNKILKLPFLLELMDGTLPGEKFYYYINQDSIYLGEFGRVMAAIASRLSNPIYRDAFLHFAKDSIEVEQSLHETYLKESKFSFNKEPSPPCLLYTSFLAKQVLFNSVEIALASVLPCFWIYQKVGNYIVKNQKNHENPYQNWINSYGGDEFAVIVKKAIDICDEIAEKSHLQAEMTQAFKIASKMEWMFWESAYSLEEWRIDY